MQQQHDLLLLSLFFKSDRMTPKGVKLEVDETQHQ